MRQQVAQWLYSDSEYGNLITWNELADCIKDNFRVRADRLLTLISQDIENVENDYQNDDDLAQYLAFNKAKQKILARFKEKGNE